jgi:hypothetical protein
MLGHMSADSDHLSAALRVIDAARSGYVEALLDAGAEIHEHESGQAHVHVAQQEQLASMLRELRALWREQVSPATAPGKVSVETSVQRLSFAGGPREASISMAADGPAGTLMFIMHLPGRSWLLWNDSEDLPEAPTWAQRVDRAIVRRGRAILAGELPSLSLL